MSDFRAVQNALTEISMTAEEMDKIWAYMYDKNWKIKSLTNSGKDWSDLTIPAMRSLVEQYNKTLEVQP
jgi:wobble nucleotide-excising tRNase